MTAPSVVSAPVTVRASAATVSAVLAFFSDCSPLPKMRISAGAACSRAGIAARMNGGMLKNPFLGSVFCSLAGAGEGAGAGAGDCGSGGAGCAATIGGAGGATMGGTAGAGCPPVNGADEDPGCLARNARHLLIECVGCP